MVRARSYLKEVRRVRINKLDNTRSNKRFMFLVGKTNGLILFEVAGFSLSMSLIQASLTLRPRMKMGIRIKRNILIMTLVLSVRLIQGDCVTVFTLACPPMNMSKHFPFNPLTKRKLQFCMNTSI